MNDDTYFGQVRHWLVSNISTGSDGSLNISQGNEISPYLGPAPLPNYLYSRPHRYVFIVASGSGQVNITPEDLQELQQPYVAAISGKQSDLQDLKDRWGFNAQKLIEKKGLKLEAVNFMRVHGNLSSAVANAGLMGQAALNKVSIGLHLNFVTRTEHISGPWKMRNTEKQSLYFVTQLAPHGTKDSHLPELRLNRSKRPAKHASDNTGGNIFIATQVALDFCLLTFVPFPIF